MVAVQSRLTLYDPTTEFATGVLVLDTFVPLATPTILPAPSK